MNSVKKVLYVATLPLLLAGHLQAQSIARKAIDSLRHIIQTAANDSVKIEAMGGICWHLNQLGEIKAARQTADSILLLSEKIRFRHGIAMALYFMGLMATETGDYKTAREKLQAAYAINTARGHKRYTSDNLTNLGNVFFYEGNLSEAAASYLSSLKLEQEMSNTAGILRLHNNLGAVYTMQGQYENALTHFLKLLSVGEEKKVFTSHAIGNMNLGDIYTRMENYPKAMEHYETGLRFSEKDGWKAGIAQITRRIGKVLELQKQYPESLEKYNTALRLLTEAGMTGQLPDTYVNIGSVYIATREYEKAMTQFREALKYYEKTSSRERLSNCLIRMGEAETGAATLSGTESEKNRKYEDAAAYLSRGLTIAKEIGARENIRNAQKAFSELYMSQGDYKKAFQYYTAFVAIKDSVFNSESARKLEQQRTRYEVEKAVTEEKAQKEIALAEERALKEKALVEERVENEKRLAIQRNALELKAAEDKFRFELALADERTEQEMIKAEEILKKEQALAGERYKSGQVLAATTARQEREKAAIKRRNELLLMGSGMLLLALVFFFLYQRQRVQKQQAVERADTVQKMAELELQSLRAQLNPHFMFNSLNAIQELILMEDNERSHIYLSRFSKLIRTLLENANQPFIPLKKEIDFLELYLSLEKLRIPDLQYAITTDPGVDPVNTSIPNMMLQPFIENAIWHGLSPKKGEKNLWVNIRRENNAVEYCIEDNGIGRQKAGEMKSLYRKEHKSKGMELLTKRFKLLNEQFGSEITTHISDVLRNGQVGGTKVTIRVPGLVTEPEKLMVV